MHRAGLGDAMNTDTKATFINLRELQWSRFVTVTGGGGASDFSVAPFLWVVYFKVDVASLFGDFFFTPGDHRNLGVADVDPGQMISIPDAIGTVSFGLTPITTLNGKVIPPIFGAVVVLMRDGGHVTPHGIEAGHTALNFGVRAVVEQLAEMAVAQETPPSPQQIADAASSAKLNDKVAAAVQSAQSTCENLWACSGADSEIAHNIVTWSTDEFADPSETKDFSLILDQSAFSTWTVSGSVTVTSPCLPTASVSALEKAFQTIASQGATGRGDRRTPVDLRAVLDLMRTFKERKALLSDTTLAEWWTFVNRYAPELACRLATSRSMQERARPLVDALAAHLLDDDKKISPELVQESIAFLEALQTTASSRLRNDLSTAAVVMERLGGRTLHEALNVLATRSVAILKQANRRPL